MSKAWQWFLANGDKLLTGVSTALVAMAATGLIPAGAAWYAVITGVLGVVHTVFFPEPAPAGGTVQSQNTNTKQGGHARVEILAAVAGLAILTLGVAVSCKTLPTGSQQAGINAAVDIAVGLAVQEGQPQAAWAPRAAQFEAAAKALATVNAAGPTSLQSLMADLQPYIAKLGPADVLAANALVAALTPIVQAQLGTNPTLANTQAEISLILQDVIAACSAYTGA